MMFIQCEHDVDISLKCETCYKILENPEDLFILIMSYLIFNNSFPYSFCLFYVFFPEASRILYILGLNPSLAAIGRPAHSSFILPRTFLFFIL